MERESLVSVTGDVSRGEKWSLHAVGVQNDGLHEDSPQRGPVRV